MTIKEDLQETYVDISLIRVDTMITTLVYTHGYIDAKHSCWAKISIFSIMMHVGTFTCVVVLRCNSVFFLIVTACLLTQSHTPCC